MTTGYGTAAALLLLCAVLLCAAGERCLAEEGGRFDIHIYNRPWGGVWMESPAGGRRRIGRVLSPLVGAAHVVKEGEFTAARWGDDSSVVACAVNALHVRCGRGEGYGEVISFLPIEFKSPPGGYSSYLDGSASLVTDIPAGSGVFGGEETPVVGARVKWRRGPYERFRPLPAGYEGRIGDEFLVECRSGAARVRRIEIANECGGPIYVEDERGRRRIGVVARPVWGTGRFGGTLYCGCGMVRANHPGVICISTSARGRTGGFQIVPAAHAEEPPLRYMVFSPAYMIVCGPGGTARGTIAGTAPLFRGVLRAGRWRVLARRHGENSFHPFAPVEGRTSQSLRNIAWFRLEPIPPAPSPSVRVR